MLPAPTALPRWVNAVPISVIRFGSLGPFKKLRKATVCFVMSVSLCPSVRMEQLGSSWTDFPQIFYSNIFSKIYRENSRVIKTGQE